MPRFTTMLTFRISWIALLLAIVAVAGLPVGCGITSRNNSGWDFLQDDIAYLSVTAVAFATLILMSFFSGVHAARDQRIAWLWVFPLGCAILTASCLGMWGAYGGVIP